MSQTGLEAETGEHSLGELPAIPRAALIVLGALLLGETTINSIDRQVVAVLAPALRDEFGWTNIDYAKVQLAFLITYAISYSFAGWVLDRLGIRRGLKLAVTWWSTAGALMALSQGAAEHVHFQVSARDRRRRRVAVVCQSSRNLDSGPIEGTVYRSLQQRIESRRHDRCAPRCLDHCVSNW